MKKTATIILGIWILGFLVGIWIAGQVEDKWITQFALWKLYTRNIIRQGDVSNWEMYSNIFFRQLFKIVIETILLCLMKKKGLYWMLFLDSFLLSYCIGIWLLADGFGCLLKVFYITEYNFVAGVSCWCILLYWLNKRFLWKQGESSVWKKTVFFCIMVLGLCSAKTVLETILTFVLI